MVSFGKKIRRERQRRGITLVEVSNATKISLQYLGALERNDFRKLPGGVFNRGYVRAFAQSVGANPERMVRAYLAEEQARGVEDKSQDFDLLRSSLAAAAKNRAQQGGSARRRRKARILSVAASLSLGALALAGWYFLEQRPGEDTRTHRIAATWSGVLNAVRESFATGGSVIAPEPEPGGPTGPSEQEQKAPILRDDPSHLSVPEFGVGTAVVGHELQDRYDRFDEGSVVSFWTPLGTGFAGPSYRADRRRHRSSGGGKSISRP